MIRRILIYASLVIVFFGAMHVLSKVQTETESSDPVVMEEVVLRRVQVLPITPQPFEQSILVPGVVEANADIALAVGIAGIVERVNVKEGDFVKAGQELFQIDLRSRMAMLEEARAAHALAEKTWKRTETLRKKGDVTIQEFDEAQSREIQAAAAVRRLEVEISLGHVYAPQNGIIDRVDVEEGEYLRDGVSMARLLALDPVKISVGIPEKFADAVAQQKTALVFIEALNEQRMGKIDRLAYGADERTKTFKATVILENKDYRIRPGMIVRAQIVVK
ncbi:MAG: efflux RND transporter periplasmic adaptor subunit, partial [bacterium]|nr:efflux RND transporter periplasmic adaptor subunit [bacterium]